MGREPKLVFQIKLEKRVWTGTGRGSLEPGGDGESRFGGALMMSRLWDCGEEKRIL